MAAMDCFVALLPCANAARLSQAMTKTQTGSLIALSLPVADTAGLARPDLNPGVERLGIERTVVASREFGSRRTTRFLGTRLHNTGLVDGNCGLRFWLRACLRPGACVIGVHVKRTGRKPGSKIGRAHV